jgi:hypothetical protein
VLDNPSGDQTTKFGALQRFQSRERSFTIVFLNQTASRFARPAQRSYGWRFSLFPHALFAAATAIGEAARAFVRAPALPEPDDLASIALPGVLHKSKTFDPDPFGTEHPFISDSWPR